MRKLLKHASWYSGCCYGITLFFLLFLISSVGVAQVPVALSPVARQQFLDPNGHPLAGGKLCTYNAGTTTPAATYVDINGIILNTNPIVLDSGGFATIYLANQEYKFTLYDGSGNTACPNTGVQQWSQDNVSAFQVVVGTQTIVFAGVTSDPVGVAGTVDYRSDLGCLRLFTTVWDCFLTQNNALSVTNKTFNVSSNIFNNTTNTAGHYLRNNGTQYVDAIIQPQDVSGVSVPSTLNCASPGTVAFAPALLGNAAGTACVNVPTTAQTSGIIGFCFQGCGTTGSAILIQTGQSNCTFDGPTVAGDYVQTSQTVQGQCHDAGNSIPVGVQTLGRVLQTTAGGVALVDLTLSGAVNQSGVVFSTPSAVTSAAIGSTLIGVPTQTATFRISAYATQTALGASCSSNPAILLSLTFQDTNAVAPQSQQVVLFQITGNGVLGVIPVGSAIGTTTYRSKAGVSMTYSTTYTGLTGCSPNPSYQIFPIVEQLTQN